MSTKKPHALLKSAAIVAVASALAKLTGFAREIVLAAFYGAGTTSDAFILAFTIPDMLLLFVSASVASSYIPMYYRTEDKTKFTRSLMSYLLIIGLVFSAIFTAFPQVLARLFAAQADAETLALASYFLQYMVWSAPFILLTDIFNAQLEIYGNFFSAGIRSMWRNGVVILGLVIGAISGQNIYIAMAPVVGSALCVASLALACRKQGFAYRPEIVSHVSEIKQMLFIAAPIFLSTSVNEINTIVSKNFAASLSSGAISALNYSSKVHVLLVSLIGSPLIIVLFPHMSKLASDKRIGEIKNTLTRSILFLTGIMLPICIGAILLAQPLIRIMFQRGNFTEMDTVETASCLQMYALMLVTSSIISLLIRGFYVLKDAKIPARISIAAAGVNIAAVFLLAKPMGVQGLALATTMSSWFNAALLLVFLRKKLGHLGLRNNWAEFMKIAFASLFMGGGVWFIASKLPLMTTGTLWSLILCGVVAAVGAIVYATLLMFFRSKVAFEVAIMILKFIDQKRKKAS
jgi:putative peptidoglycan lipid II flippase